MPGAAADLFLCHLGLVKAVALKTAPWPDLVDDIVQQVFLEFIRKEARWDLDADLRPLLAAMTRKVALRQWRQMTHQQSEMRLRLSEHIRSLADTFMDAEGAEQRAEKVGQLRQCMENLPERSRQMIEAYYFSGHSPEVIGAQNDMKPDTVRRNLSRIRVALRDCLESAQCHAAD